MKYKKRNSRWQRENILRQRMANMKIKEQNISAQKSSLRKPVFCSWNRRFEKKNIYLPYYFFSSCQMELLTIHHL